MVLSLEGEQRGEDGLLRVDEVTGLRLNADLAVLSACQTGRGQVFRSEGVSGPWQSIVASAILLSPSGQIAAIYPIRATAPLPLDIEGSIGPPTSRSPARAHAINPHANAARWPV